jgi:alpha-1,6-mannosyltransferase
VVTAAPHKHPACGVLLCALAAAIKVPAALGLVYIGWEWAGPGAALGQRVRKLLVAGGLAGAVMLALSVVSGLGVGWVGNLATPGTVRSWLAPATGVGMGITSALHAVGLEVSQGGVLSVTRVTGLLAAAGLSAWLLWASERIGALKALGLSLLFFVLLGPVVQPWYLTWGIVLLAPVATGRLRNAVIALSVISPFIGLPGGRTLLAAPIHENPFWMAAGLVALVLVCLAPLGQWATAWREPEPDYALGTGTS